MLWTNETKVKIKISEDIIEEILAGFFFMTLVFLIVFFF